MLPLPSNSVLGCRYRILRSLGDGGFGQTFLAEDLKYPFQPQCVVKRLLPQSQNPSLLEITRRLFQKEIEVLKELGKHDRIPELLDSFEENGEFYLVQQYIDGEDLEGKIVGLNESETIYLIREVLEILEFVHGKSVIHRDIKPSNVIRRRHDDKLVVIDFGAVKQINSPSVIPSKKSVSVAVGTPGYMPSEQAGGRPRYNSDIYATGMLGIYALTGIQPGEIPRDENTGELIWRESVRCPLSQQFEAVLKKMVRDHFSLRYQTVTEVLKDLKDLNEIPRTVVRESDSDPIPPTVISDPHPLPSEELTLQDWLKKSILWIFLLITGGGSIIVLSFMSFKLPQASPVTATRGLYLLPRVVQGVQEGCCGTSNPPPEPSNPSPTPINSPSPPPLDDPPNPRPPVPPEPNPSPPAPPIPPKPNPSPPSPPPRNDDLPCSIAGC